MSPRVSWRRCKERRREPRVSMPMFLEEFPTAVSPCRPSCLSVRTHSSPYPIQGKEVAALIHTATHISLMSASLVHELGVRQEVLPDTSVPPSPLTAGQYCYLICHFKVQGRRGWWRKAEICGTILQGSKHVTQLHVARDLPADLVLGVDFLKKAQVQVSFPENAITLPSGNQETKVSFLTSKEMNQHQRRSSNAANTPSNKTRAYSSNY
ncbi:hypothetical protein Hamer_G011978 [Homarus americanus]|uniref:Uncharacterized protein n=1 Tax=Homarus americanus TaxID=6706 RepID=A0A8J5MWB1_HOMAM|nr:hypothetical protein Hamer_G011978 [Homarus americanus]